MRIFRVIDAPFLAAASWIMTRTFRGLGITPPRQILIARIGLFSVSFILCTLVISMAYHDGAKSTAWGFLGGFMGLFGIFAVQTSFSSLKQFPRQWTANGFKRSLISAMRFRQNQLGIRLIFPVAGLEFLSTIIGQFRSGEDPTGAVVDLMLAILMFGLAGVSYMMAAEPPLPDEGDTVRKLALTTQ